MTIDTVFDIASLTKVVATTTSVMMLVEQGRLRLNDRVASYIPGFERYGKRDITIRHLLTHVSGLRPDLDLADMWSGYDTGIALAIEEVPTAPPGRALRLQRHQLLSARRHRPPRQRHAARRVRARADLRAARHARDDVPSAGRDAAAHRTDRTLLGARLAVRGPRRYACSAASSTIRPRGAWAAWPDTRGCSARAADLSIFCRMLLAGGDLPRRQDPRRR